VEDFLVDEIVEVFIIGAPLHNRVAKIELIIVIEFRRITRCRLLHNSIIWRQDSRPCRFRLKNVRIARMIQLIRSNLVGDLASNVLRIASRGSREMSPFPLHHGSD